MSEKESTSKTVCSKNTNFLANHFMILFQNQSESLHVFDNKISWFFIFQGAILIFFLEQHPTLSLLLILSILLSVIAVFPRDFKRAYNSNKIIKEFWTDEIDIDNAQAKIAIDIDDAIQENAKTIKRKSKYAKASIIVFIVFLIGLAISIFQPTLTITL